jgi:hypothetical protein
MGDVAEPSPAAATDEEVSSGGAPASESGRAVLSFLRHPLVVGAVVAAIGGVFASLLIPAATRSWQDRPRELALKRELVERISKSSAGAVQEAVSFGLYVAPSEPSGSKRREAFHRAARDGWLIESAVIGAQLDTYFGDTSLPEEWSDHVSTVLDYIAFEAFWGGNKWTPGERLEELSRDFRNDHFDDYDLEENRKSLADEHVGKIANVDEVLATLIGAERKQVTKKVLAADAAGFSHGFWIFDD